MDQPSTYKRGRPNPLHGEMATSASALCDLMRDQLAMFSTRAALEAWLAHPRTARFLERLRFTPGEHETWAEMQDRIAAARDWLPADDPTTPPPEGITTP